ncbi:MAG: hypothetical protein OQK98_16425 [Gammaproteobacteria bacterium]|nr:hypothetical protein [Gammaproteobacteria bacterium]
MAQIQLDYGRNYTEFTDDISLSDYVLGGRRIPDAGCGLAGVFSAISQGVFSGFRFADGIGSISGQLKVQFIGVIVNYRIC